MSRRFIYNLCFCLFFAVAIAPFSLRAETLTHLQECVDANSTNTAWAICNWNEVKAQEKLLKETWEKLKAKYWNREEGYQALLTDQKQWDLFKESACKVYDIDFGREGQVLSYPSCKATLISQRIEYLRTILNSMEQ